MNSHRGLNANAISNSLAGRFAERALRMADNAEGFKETLTKQATKEIELMDRAQERGREVDPRREDRAEAFEAVAQSLDAVISELKEAYELLYESAAQ